MQKAIIVAKGNSEDTCWLKDIDSTIEPYIYTPTDLAKDYGREAGVYLDHLLNNWDKVVDINIFCQGHAPTHCADIVERINRIEELLGNRPFLGLGDWNIAFDRKGFPEHPGIPLVEVWEKLWPGKDLPPKLMRCCAGGQFAVTGEKIRQVGKEFIERIKKIIDYSPLAIECYCIERYWHRIFG